MQRLAISGPPRSVKLITILVGLLIVGCAPTDTPGLIELEPIDRRAHICPCKFNQSFPDSAEGSYGSGPTVLVLDHNGNPPSAIVNTGEGNIRLPAESFQTFECSEDETWAVRWSSDAVILETELDVEGPGAEACWFSGQAVLINPVRKTIPVKGGCGC